MTHCAWQGGFKTAGGERQAAKMSLCTRPDKAGVSARHTDTRLLLRKCLCLCTVYCLLYPRAGCADKTLLFAHSQSSLSSAALTPECSIHTYPCLHIAPLHDKRQIQNATHVCVNFCFRHSPFVCRCVGFFDAASRCKSPVSCTFPCI